MEDIKSRITKKKETKGNKMLTNKLRTNKIPRKSNKFAQENNTTQLTTKEKKKIFIVGNFMFKILLEQVFKDHTVKSKYVRLNKFAD